MTISPTFYEHLVRRKIPKAQKKLLDLTVFFALLGSDGVKAAHRMLMKLTPRLVLVPGLPIYIIEIKPKWYNTGSNFKPH